MDTEQPWHISTEENNISHYNVLLQVQEEPKGEAIEARVHYSKRFSSLYCNALLSSYHVGNRDIISKTLIFILYVFVVTSIYCFQLQNSVGNGLAL